MRLGKCKSAECQQMRKELAIERYQRLRAEHDHTVKPTQSPVKDFFYLKQY